MSKELKVVYRDFKVKYSVIPNEIILQPKYNRAKKKADDIKLLRPSDTSSINRGGPRKKNLNKNNSAPHDKRSSAKR